MLNADVVVFATRIYYYEISGQTKTMLAQSNPIYVSDYAFKDIYLLDTTADNKSTVDGTIKVLKGWISCFDSILLSGVVKDLGADNTGAIQRDTVIYGEGKIHR